MVRGGGPQRHLPNISVLLLQEKDGDGDVGCRQPGIRQGGMVPDGAAGSVPGRRTVPQGQSHEAAVSGWATGPTMARVRLLGWNSSAAIRWTSAGVTERSLL